MRQKQENESRGRNSQIRNEMKKGDTKNKHKLIKITLFWFWSVLFFFVFFNLENFFSLENWKWLLGFYAAATVIEFFISRIDVLLNERNGRKLLRCWGYAMRSAAEQLRIWKCASSRFSGSGWRRRRITSKAAKQFYSSERWWEREGGSEKRTFCYY